ncbi:MAG TPA: hypothetical protein DCR40_18140 [Prolixibacteraceae bacterium]|nr:hypothetical protein [Prolixibacteraceae bacterium]
MILAIDFDGTIAVDRFPEIGKPIPQAFDTLSHFKAAGHKLILWTCREDSPGRKYLTEAIEFCRNYGIEFDAVNDNLPDAPFCDKGNSRKVYADYYIDDKSMFPLWEAYAGGVL